MNIIKEALMKRYCPRYLEDMPKEDNELTYKVVVYKFSSTKETVLNEKIVKGRINAYKQARWLALKADWTTHYAFGIGYYLVGPQYAG
jgi:hypothetical protein